MAFQVELSAHATQNIEETYVWIQEQNPTAAEKLFNGIMAAIHTLKDFPHRCPKIPEQDSFTQEIRHFIYQKHRIIFTAHNTIVYILAVRHTAKKPLESEDLEEMPGH